MVLRKHTLQKRDGLLLQIVCFMKSPQMFVHAGKFTDSSTCDNSSWPKSQINTQNRKISLHQFLDGSPAAYAAETQASSLPSPTHLGAAQVDDNN
jgi:hypothetical protein